MCRPPDVSLRHRQRQRGRVALTPDRLSTWSASPRWVHSQLCQIPRTCSPGGRASAQLAMQACRGPHRAEPTLSAILCVGCKLFSPTTRVRSASFWIGLCVLVVLGSRLAASSGILKLNTQNYVCVSEKRFHLGDPSNISRPKLCSSQVRRELSCPHFSPLALSPVVVKPMRRKSTCVEHSTKRGIKNQLRDKTPETLVLSTIAGGGILLSKPECWQG